MKKYIKFLILFLLLIAIAGFSHPGPAAANVAGTPFNGALRGKQKENFTSIQLKGGVEIDRESQVVTLNLRDSDLRQVLRMLADKAGKNIVIHDSVDGTITIDLVDVELNKAFEYIMTIQELTYWEDDNTLIIAKSGDAQKLGINMSEVRGIKIKHVDASRIASFLNKNVFSVNRPNTSTSSIVTTNPATNEILIFGSREDIKLAEEVIKYLDLQPNVTNFVINFADPVGLASKICWTAFNSSDGEKNFSRDADLKEGSEITLVCGETSESKETADGDLETFKSPSYWVLADTGLNQVTIYGGTQEQINIARGIVDSFDKREPQVYIEVSLIELSEIGSKDFGHTFRLFTETNDINFSNGTATLGMIGNGDNVNNNDFQIGGEGIKYTLNGLGINSYITSLITEDKGRVLANPRIIVANNTKADIDITGDNISKAEVQIDSDTNTKTTTITTSSDEGVKFSLIPKILPSGYVNLSIEPELNTIKTQVKSGDEIQATLLNKRKLKVSNIRVKDGDTLILAGFIQETESLSHKKFPFLGDIPILGMFFQSQGTKKDRSELIIMITPRILYDPDQVVESI